MKDGVVSDFTVIQSSSFIIFRRFAETGFLSPMLLSARLKRYGA
jgi:hypothetical protein